MANTTFNGPVRAEQGFKQISIEKIPNRGIGEAINDRLLRAAVKK